MWTWHGAPFSGPPFLCLLNGHSNPAWVVVSLRQDQDVEAPEMESGPAVRFAGPRSKVIKFQVGDSRALKQSVGPLSVGPWALRRPDTLEAGPEGVLSLLLPGCVICSGLLWASVSPSVNQRLVHKVSGFSPL